MKVKSHLGPLERKIMKIVWQHDQVCVREVLSKLPVSDELAYTTVMTIMVRLVDKGFLVRKKIGKQYFYSQKDGKSVALHRMVSQTINSFVNQFGEDAVVAFIEEADKLKKK